MSPTLPHRATAYHPNAVTNSPSIVRPAPRPLQNQSGFAVPIAAHLQTTNANTENSSVKEFRSPSSLSLHGLAHSVHDFGVAGGLRRPYVSVHPRLPDKDKTAHSSHRPRQIGKMLVVLRDGRKLFGVLRSYDQFGAYEGISVLPPLRRLNVYFLFRRGAFFLTAFSQSGLGRYGREDIPPRRVRRTMGRSLSHSWRERRFTRRDREHTPKSPPLLVAILITSLCLLGP